MGKRNSEGLFKTYCESCGATIYNASDSEPHPNCDLCPGHDDIARRDQESADRELEKQKDLRKKKRNQFTSKFDFGGDNRPVFTVENFLIRSTDGTDYDRGEIETLRATVDRLQIALAKLTQVPYNRRVIKRKDVYFICDERE